MSLTLFIVKTVTATLKFGSQRPKLDGKLRDTNIAHSQDPRFTKDQFEKVMAKSQSIQPARSSLT